MRSPSRSWLSLLAVAAALGAACDGVEQAGACERYVACIRALDATLDRATDLDRFDVGGACWGSEEGALLCERACNRGLEWQARQAAAPGECQP